LGEKKTIDETNSQSVGSSTDWCHVCIVEAGDQTAGVDVNEWREIAVDDSSRRRNVDLITDDAINDDDIFSDAWSWLQWTHHAETFSHSIYLSG